MFMVFFFVRRGGVDGGCDGISSRRCQQEVFRRGEGDRIIELGDGSRYAACSVGMPRD